MLRGVNNCRCDVVKTLVFVKRPVFSKQRVSQREELSTWLTCATGARHAQRPVSNATALISFPLKTDNRMSVRRVHTWRCFSPIT